MLFRIPYCFAEVQTTFLQSKKTSRWWMQLQIKNISPVRIMISAGQQQEIRKDG